jgi:hypothetical protein
MAGRLTASDLRGGPAPIGNPVIRLGFWLFGRWTQERFYRNIQARIADVVRATQHGRPLPASAVRPDGASRWHPPGSGRIRWSAWPVDGSTPGADAGPAGHDAGVVELWTSTSGAARGSLVRYRIKPWCRQGRTGWPVPFKAEVRRLVG